MVAVVSGNGLGLVNASNTTLGAAGQVGQGLLGQAGGRSYVNASTGNLILQFGDERLSGTGLDLAALRTYNLLGGVTDGDGDGWRWDGEASVMLTSGTLNQPGSTVSRTTGDGHVAVYSWSATNSRYESFEGAGAVDTLTYTSSEWTWTDGSSQITEKYDSSGKITSRADTSGNLIIFTYSGNKLTSIKDNASGQELVFAYENNRVARIDTREINGGSLTQQVYYGYDGYGRLQTVKTDLSPDDNNILIGRLYTTTYTYDGASFRIASISQSDGLAGANSHTYVSYTYDASFRIKTVTDASGTQTFDYNPASGDNLANTTVTNQLNQVWIYSYDAKGQLKQVQTPAVDGQVITTQYAYDADGNVTQVIDGRGNSIVYQYDARGNRTLERDALGNTVTRTYDAKNQLLTETRYRVADSDGEGSALPSDPMTTRYTYNSANLLRFIVSAEGRVTEYRYNLQGNQTGTVQYTEGTYTTSSLGITDTITESQLTTWVAAQDKTKLQLSKFTYDYRGNLTEKTDYATTTTNGAGVLDNATTVTRYIYDAHGQLKKTIAVRGSTRTETADLSVIAYDGLGRLQSVTDASGTSTTLYESLNGADGSRYKINITNTATGLTTSQAFDSNGRLISVSQTATSESDRKTQYIYNAAGNLAMVQDATGNRSYTFYDAAGRVQFSVSATGKITEYKYNKNNQVTHQIEYNKLANTTGWFNGTTVTKTTLTVGVSATFDVRTDPTNDRTIQFDYDNAGRLIARIDAAGNSTQTNYNGASEVTQVQSGNRVTRYYYDHDGRQVGVLDALGYLTENKFDAAGRLVRTIKYYSRSSAVPLSPPTWTGVTNQTLLLGAAFSYNLPAAFDPNGLPLNYSVYGALPSWLSFDSANLTLTGTPIALEPVTITLRATNSDGATVDVSITLTGIDNAPVWQTLSNQTQAVNSVVDITLPVAVDPDGHSVTYSVLGLPAGLVFDANNRKISGTLSSPGIYTVTAKATDSFGVGTTKTFTFTVTNAAPTWGALNNWTQAVNSAVNITLPAAVDPEGQALTYSITNLPPGLSFNATSRQITGVLTAPGTYIVTAIATDPNTVFANKTFTFTVTNSAPVWPTVTPPQAKVSTTYTYTVPAATDAEGQVITYSAISLPPGFTFNATTRVLSGPIGNSSTSLPVTLQATDANGLFSNLSFNIVITNEVPVYQTGSLLNQSAKTHHGFTYQVPANAFSDANNDTLTYTAYWLQEVWQPSGAEGGGSYVTQANALPEWLGFNASTRTFTGTSLTAATYAIEVRATDPSGAMASAQFGLTVSLQSPPIKGTPLSNGVFTYGSAGNYTLPAGAFTDADGDVLTYSAVWEQTVYQGTNSEGAPIYSQVSGPLPSGLTINSTTGTISSNGSVPATSYTIVIKATDPSGASATSNLTLLVNSAPTTGAGSLPNAMATSGSSFVYLIPANAFSDDQQGSLTYTASGLPAGLSFSGSTISGTPTVIGGSYTVTITATDPYGLSKSRSFTLSVNSAPVYQTGSLTNQSGKTAHGYSYTVPANAFTDANNETLSYSAYWLQEVWQPSGTEGGGSYVTQANALPGWLSFNASTRTFSGTPPTAGTFNIQVRATDPNAAWANGQFTLTVNNQAAPVSVTALPTVVFTSGSTTSYTLPAGAFTDADGDALTYTAVWSQTVYQGTNSEGAPIYSQVSSPLPSGLTINSATGTISSNGSVVSGSYTIVITAADPAGASATSNLSLVVNSAPTTGAGSLPNVSANYGSFFNYAIPSNAFSDDQQASLTYTVSGLPSGLSLSGSTISGTIAAIGGIYTVTVTARDPHGLTAARNFTISVNAIPVYQSGITNQSAKTAHGFNYTIPSNAFTDANNDTLSYSAYWLQEVWQPSGTEGGGSYVTQANALPGWLSFNASTRTFSGTPPTAGTFNIQVRAADPSGTWASAQYTLTVNNQAAPVNSTALPGTVFTYGSAANYALPGGAFTDADGDALTYSATANGSTLPAGLTINSSTGTISSNGGVAAGTYTIQVRATDIAGASATGSFTLVVNRAPTTGAGSLPNVSANYGSSFNYAIPSNAFSDDQQASLTYTVSGLPSGLSLSGSTISGTIAAIGGNYTVTVTARDPHGLTASRIFTISVNAIPVYQSGITNKSAKTAHGFNYTIPSNAFTDANNDTLSYSAYWLQEVWQPSGTEGGGSYVTQANALPGWLSFNASTRTFSGTPPTAGTFNIQVRAADPSGTWASAQYTLTVNNQAAPVNGTALPGTVFTYGNAANYVLPAGAFTDADGDALTYTAVWSQTVYQGTNSEGAPIYSQVSSPLPSGLTINSATGTISSNGSVVSGSYTIVITAADPAGASATSNLSLVVNSTPTTGAGALPNASAWIGSNFTYSVPSNAFSDDQQASLTYSASGMPAGITFNSGSRAFSGITTGSAGNYTVTVTAIDPYGRTSSRSFTVTVAAANVAPVYQNNMSNQTTTAGRAMSYALPSNAFTDANGDALTYTAYWLQEVWQPSGAEGGGSYVTQANALPGWLSFNASTRTFSGTPPTAGTFNIQVRATDPSNAMTSGQFRITAIAQTGPAYQNGLTAQTARKSSAFNYQFSGTAFTDANGDALTYTAYWVQQVPSGGGSESGGGTTTQYTALPSWLSFNASTRTFSGTPPTSALSSYNIQVRATDAGGSNQTVSGSFTITVLAAMAAAGSPSFNIANLANGANISAMSAEVNPYVDVLAALRPASSANDVSTWYYYDGQGRVTGSVDEQGFLAETVYDEANNTRRTNQYMGTVAPTASSTLSNLKSLAGGVEGNLLNYDLKGRLVKQTAFDNTTTDYEYDSAGRLVRTLVGAGQTELDGTSAQRGTRTLYNAFGEVVGAVSGVGEATLAANPEESVIKSAISTYGVAKKYDALGRTIQTTDANGNKTLYYYDGDSRLRYTVSALGDVSEYKYNAFDQVESSINYYNRLSPIASLTGGSAADLATSVTNLADSRDQKITSVYNTRGLLDNQTDAEGFKTSYAYNSYGELESDTHILNISTGTAVTNKYSYNNLGRLIQSINDLGGLGLATKTFYDAFGRISTLTDARGKVTSYSYVSSDGNNAGRTVTVTDPLLRTNKTEYDAFDRTLKVYDGFGRATVYSYTDANRSFTVTTPENITVTTHKTRSGEVAKVTDDRGGSIKYQYNANGQLKKVTDARNKTTTENVYDNSGRLWTTTDVLGTVVELGYDALNRVITRTVDPTGLNLKTTYEFNALGQQFRVTEAPNSLVERITEFTYDRKGQLSTVVTDPAGLKLQTTYAYDGAGNTLTVAKGTTTNQNQQITQYVFDKAGRRTSEIVDPVTTQNPSGLGITTTYKYDGNGNVSRKIDANGNSTWYVYDEANQLKFTVDALGGVTGNTYDANGRLTEVIQYNNRVSTSSFGNEVKSLSPIVDLTKDRKTAYTYDKDGRLTQTTLDPYSAQNPSGLGITTQTYYDKNGNVTRTIDANNNSTWYIYDANNRQTHSIDMLGYVTYSQYDDAGNLIQATRYSNAISVGTIVNANIVTSVSPVASTDPAAPDRVTGYVYDKAGRQRFTIDSLGYVSETIYNDLGQVAEQRRYSDAVKVLSNTPRTESALQTLRGTNTLADSVTRGEIYTYDKAGRLKTTTDAKGETETYGYDAFGNRTSLINKNQKTWTYVYDKANRLTDEITPPVVVASIDAAGVVTTVIQAITTHNEYDGLGNVRFRTEAYGTTSARKTEYQYDKLGRQTVTLLPGYYNPATGVVQATEVAGSFVRTVTVTYDSLGNAIQNTIKVGPGNNDVIYQTKVYDKVGRVAFEIDALNQVTGYTYDAMGNQKTITRYTQAAYNPVGSIYAANDAVVSIGGRDRIITIGYDVLGRKTSVTQASVPTNFYPDKLAANNSQQTASSVAGAPTTRYEYNAFNEVVRESVQVNTTEWAKTYHYYNSLGQKTVDIDALGFYTTYGYDVFGNLNSQYEFTNPVADSDLAALGATTTGIIGLPPLPTTHGNDRSTSYLYNELNQRTDIIRANLSYYSANGTDAKGNITYAVTSSTSVTAWKGEYDKVGNLTNQYDAAGNKTTTVYDELGRTQGSIDVARNAAGITTGTSASGNDPFLNQVAAATPTISYALDAFGAVISETRTSGGAKGVEQGQSLVITHRYDLAGNEIATTDALGNTVLKQYDSGSHLVKETQAVTANFTGWAAGNYDYTLEKRYVYDLTGRQVASLEVYTDSVNVKQQTGKASFYNVFGDIIEEYLVWGAASLDVNVLRNGVGGSGFNNAATSNYTYDKGGRLISKIGQDGVTKYLYDLAGRNTRVEHQGNTSADDGTVTRVIETVYDLLGRAKVQRGPQFNALDLAANTLATANQTTTLVNPKTSQEYDRWGNIISRTDAAGSMTTYTYNADNKVITELFSGTPNLTHEIHYDKLGRSVEDVQKNNGTESRKRRSEYNQAGQLIASVDGTNVRTEFAYDGFGNQIATRNALGTVTLDSFDANGNQLRHSILRNSATGSVNNTADYYVSVGQTQSNLNLTGHEVVLQSYQYDQAGRRIADGKVSTSTTSMQWVWVPNAVSEGGSYQYQSVTSVTPGNANYYRYDERNNVIATRNPTGITKTSEFNFANQKVKEIDGAGGVMSWLYNTDSYTVGQLKSHTDLGNHITSYTYNDFGQTQTETIAGRVRTYGYTENGLLKSLSESWTEAYSDPARYSTNNGSTLGSSFNSTDTVTAVTKYDYNINGQQVRHVEQHTRTGTRPNTMVYSSPTGEGTYYSTTRALDALYTYETDSAYDQLGRLTQVSTPTGGQVVSGNGSPNEVNTLGNLTYSYDEFGNRLQVASRYTPQGGTEANQTLTYQYDNEGRITNANGMIIDYDKAGRRSHTETAGSNQYANPYGEGSPTGVSSYQNLYKYTDTGQIRSISGGSVSHATNFSLTTITAGQDAYLTVKDSRQYDTQGYMTYQKSNNTETTNVFLVDGRMSSQTVKENGKTSGITTYTDYDGAGNLRVYNYQVYNSNGSYQYTLTYTNTYGAAGKFDSYKQTGQTAHSSQNGSTDGQTTFNYDFRGNLTSVSATGSTGFSRYLTNNMLGQIVSKREYPSNGTSWQQSYVYVNGNQVAQLGKNNQFDMGVTGATGNSGTTLSITNDIASTSGQYVVNSSDNLFSIAQAVWGDSSQWYLIADANGINVAPDAALTNYVGQSLRLPNVARSEHNNATTFKPYNPQEIIGDTTPSPTPPPPPKKSCNALAMIAIIVVAVILTVVTAGAFAAASGAMITTATGTVAASSVGVMTAGAAALSGGIVAGAAAGSVAAALGTVGTAMAAGAIGGFVGSVGSQLVGVATGQQEHFSLRQAVSSGITGGITAGLGGMAASSNVGWAETAAGYLGGNQWQNYLARGAFNYVSSQAANRIAGVDTSFSWKGMAASAVGNMAGQAIGGQLPLGKLNTESFAWGNVAQGIISGAATGKLNQQWNRGGKVDYAQIAIDAFGNAVAQSLVAAMTPKLASISVASAEEVPSPASLATPNESPTESLLGSQPTAATKQVIEEARPSIHVVGKEGSKGYWGVAKSILGSSASNAEILAYSQKLMSLNSHNTLRAGDELTLPTADAVITSEAKLRYANQDAKYQANRAEKIAAINNLASSDTELGDRMNILLSLSHGIDGIHKPSFKSPFGRAMNPAGSYGNIIADAEGRARYIQDELVENKHFREKAASGEMTYKEASEAYTEQRNNLKDLYREKHTSPEANEAIRQMELIRQQNGDTTTPTNEQIYNKRRAALEKTLGREPTSNEVYKEILEKGKSNPTVNAEQAAKLAKAQAVVSKAQAIAKPLAVAGAALDGYSLGTEINASLDSGKWDNTGKEAARIAGGWTGAWAGGKAGAAVGAAAGAGVGVWFFGAGAAPGAAIGGFIGGLGGSIAGYWGGSKAGENVYERMK